MSIESSTIGARIKYYRTKMHLSQEQLAEQTNLTNVYISYLECGERMPSLDAIVRIVNALNISADDLLSDNLLVSSSFTDSREYEILYDCSPEELNIILATMKHLKEQLRNYHIT